MVPALRIPAGKPPHNAVKPSLLQMAQTVCKGEVYITLAVSICMRTLAVSNGKEVISAQLAPTYPAANFASLAGMGAVACCCGVVMMMERDLQYPEHALAHVPLVQHFLQGNGWPVMTVLTLVSPCMLSMWLASDVRPNDI